MSSHGGDEWVSRQPCDKATHTTSVADGMLNVSTYDLFMLASLLSIGFMTMHCWKNGFGDPVHFDTLIKISPYFRYLEGSVI